MDKYNKHRFFTALVLEIRASLYSTPSDAIFISKFSPGAPEGAVAGEESLVSWWDGTHCRSVDIPEVQ